MKQKIAVLLATFFGAGRLPKAPGTWGTLAALPFAFAFSFLSAPLYLLICVALFIVGVWASDEYEKSLGEHDCSEIVIDEVVGLLVSVAVLPMSAMTLFLGFVLFRFFDVLKPFPISYLDRKVPGGMGVMVDDLLAGIIVNVILQIVNLKTGWLLIGGLT